MAAPAATNAMQQKPRRSPPEAGQRLCWLCQGDIHDCGCSSSAEKLEALEESRKRVVSAFRDSFRHVDGAKERLALEGEIDRIAQLSDLLLGKRECGDVK